MSGIYIHVPFCKKACHYCNFHFSTTMIRKEEMTAAICKEMVMRKSYLDGQQIDSIYFGGGTPSVLSESELCQLLSIIRANFTVSENAEITFECNPDDLTAEYLRVLYEAGINRLSIGVQSFYDEDLKWMNRAHDSKQAMESIRLARIQGFQHISVDLIYGVPTLSDEAWKSNIETVLSFGINHISSYALTVEEKTVLHNWVKMGKMKPMDEHKSSAQFDVLMDTLIANDFLHYEISNFAREGHLAVHNTNYWKGIPYLGVGPSAHSYNGVTRSWNISNNSKYLDHLMMETLAFEEETLSESDRYNEYIMTGLRTLWGIDLAYIRSNFGIANFETISQQIELPSIQPWIRKNEYIITLTSSGKHFADRIASDLFMV